MLAAEMNPFSQQHPTIIQILKVFLEILIDFIHLFVITNRQKRNDNKNTIYDMEFVLIL